MPSPSLLAIETSVETGSVALLRDGVLILERSFEAGRRPSASLWPSLEEVMQEVEELSAIVVGIGPGSYNGSRVGIAAAQGIAVVHGCEVAPVCSFEGVATSGAQALAIGDARRGSFSLQAMSDGRLHGDFSLLDQEGLVETLEKAQQEEREVFSFDAASRFPVPEELQKTIAHRQSSAVLLAKAFLKRNESEQESLFRLPPQPFYLRDPHITLSKRKSLLERS